jgi:hypothetical protein
MKIMLPVATIVVMATGTYAVQGQVKMPNIKQQASPQAVLDEHLDALNKCDWERLIAQYPDDAQINLPNGAIVKGRPAIADLFSGFCKEPKDGGFKGIHFEVENSIPIGEIFVAQWVASAPFLTEVYKGSDAYITHDGLMQAMVSTFNSEDLKIDPNVRKKK